MTDELTIDLVVPYGEVDRDDQLLLPGIFKFLQEAAIKHANQFDTGARAMVVRGESWVLHRLAAAIQRYPRYEEPIRVVTWSSGIRLFRGYRDFRLYAGDELLVSASSLWLYVNRRTKVITRVPEAIATGFPTGHGAVFRPDLEKSRFVPPDARTARACPVSVRYSDVDGNGHVNNTAYLDFLQTALVKNGFPPRPSNVEIQFLREIPPDADTVEVRLERRGQTIAFSLGGPAALFAQGQAG
jgi:acyl-ACP thioesterase